MTDGKRTAAHTTNAADDLSSRLIAQPSVREVFVLRGGIFGGPPRGDEPEMLGLSASFKGAVTAEEAEVGSRPVGGFAARREDCSCDASAANSSTGKILQRARRPSQ